MRLFLDAKVLFTAAHDPQGKAAFGNPTRRSGAGWATPSIVTRRVVEDSPFQPRSGWSPSPRNTRSARAFGPKPEVDVHARFGPSSLRVPQCGEAWSVTRRGLFPWGSVFTERLGLRPGSRSLARRQPTDR